MPPKKSPAVVVEVEYEKKCYPDGTCRERESRKETIFTGGSQSSPPAQPSIEYGSYKK